MWLELANPHLIGQRFSGESYETEKLCAQAFNRPTAQFYLDFPTHPQLPPTPSVNFDLNYKF